MKQIAMVLIFSIILVTNSHTTLVAPTEKGAVQKLRKLAVYEQVITENNPYEKIFNKLGPSTNNSIVNDDLCTLNVHSETQTEPKENKGYDEQHVTKKQNNSPQAMNRNKQDNIDEIAGHEMTQLMIPDEAIRLRILAHSDALSDQHIKRVIRDRVNGHIREIVAHIDHIEVARTTIKGEIPTLQAIINETLIEYDKQYSFQIAFEKDVPFPLKTYGPYVYPAGEYEAILITLGDGVGENWWCVLFPPLCFIDFFNSTTVVDADDTSHDELHEEESNVEADKVESNSDIEVRFFLLDLFNFS